MDIEALEDEIVSVIRVAIPESIVEIVHLPENTADFKRPAVGGARITVGFNESNYKEVLTTKVISQPDEITLVISMQSRTLRDDVGIYRLKKRIEDAIIGYTPGDCDQPIVGIFFGPPGPGMDVLTDDVWSFVYHVKTRSVLVQAIDASDPTYLNNYRNDDNTMNNASKLEINLA